MNRCPTCGHGSRIVTLPELAAMFAEPAARPVKAAAMRDRGARIARDLDIPVHTADGIRYVLAVDVDRALGVRPTVCGHCGRTLDPDGTCPQHPPTRHLEMAS